MSGPNNDDVVKEPNEDNIEGVGHIVDDAVEAATEPEGTNAPEPLTEEEADAIAWEDIPDGKGTPDTKDTDTPAEEPELSDETQSHIARVNSRQVGGSHYQTGGLEHWDIVEKNFIPHLEACATKYAIRWQDKGGEKDVAKIIHYVEKILYEHRENGRENHAIPHKEDEFTFKRYCVDNKVPYPENAIVMGLVSWQNEDDLIDILMLVSKLHGALTIDIKGRDDGLFREKPMAKVTKEKKGTK